MQSKYLLKDKLHVYFIQHQGKVEVNKTVLGEAIAHGIQMSLMDNIANYMYVYLLRIVIYYFYHYIQSFML